MNPVTRSKRDQKPNKNNIKFKSAKLSEESSPKLRRFLSAGKRDGGGEGLT